MQDPPPSFLHRVLLLLHIALLLNICLSIVSLLLY